MLKAIMLFMFILSPLLAFAEPKVIGDSAMNFKQFARISAILNQCDIKKLPLEKEKLFKISKEEGIKLAKENNLSNDNIAQEVATILYDLDEKYPEEIPQSVCMNTFKDFQIYLKKVSYNTQKINY